MVGGLYEAIAASYNAGEDNATMVKPLKAKKKPGSSRRDRLCRDQITSSGNDQLPHLPQHDGTA
jgi:hypothetical protein